MSTPPSTTLPSVGSTKRRMSLPTVDLPQPDSPTRHSVSPGWIEKVTPSTALTCATARRKRPRSTGKCLRRPLTASTGEAGVLVIAAMSFDFATS